MKRFKSLLFFILGLGLFIFLVTFQSRGSSKVFGIISVLSAVALLYYLFGFRFKQKSVVLMPNAKPIKGTELIIWQAILVLVALAIFIFGLFEFF